TLTAPQAAKLLERIRYGAKAKNNIILVEVPAYRTDILHPFDLVEDIAIAYGYENFMHEIPQVSTIGEETPRTIMNRKIAEILTGLGLLECCTLHLSSEKILNDAMQLQKNNLVKTVNAVNIEYDVVRNALLPMLLKTLSENTHHEYPQKLFELGEVYHVEHNEPIEKNNLCIVSCHSKAEFTEMKSMIEALFAGIGKRVSFQEEYHRSFIEGRCATVLVDNKPIGIMGEIHPQVLTNFKLELPVVAFEIHVDALL
ncbi:MAG: phenylalanine--tRNA ligase subunit beta, partial [Candidatus Aenigmarchaeota archaeon]|nr:phenylalanine--tRNA ligase subunit beta [Candidatus Aenigmarchaeota archaeon]